MLAGLGLMAWVLRKQPCYRPLVSHPICLQLLAALFPGGKVKVSAIPLNLEKLFTDDWLSDRTLVERRNLLFASCLGILLHAYPADASTSSPLAWLNVTLKNASLQGAAAVAIIYLTAMFGIYVAGDVRRRMLFNTINTVPKLKKSLGQASSTLRTLFNSPASKDQHTEFLMSSQLILVDDCLTEITEAVKEFEPNAKTSEAVQKARNTFDIIVPLALAGLAICKLWSAVLPFLSRILIGP